MSLLVKCQSGALLFSFSDDDDDIPADALNGMDMSGHEHSLLLAPHGILQVRS